MNYRHGVSYFTHGKGIIDISFPEDKVCCQHCWMSYEDSMHRPMCRWLKKEIYNPKRGILIGTILTF